MWSSCVLVCHRLMRSKWRLTVSVFANGMEMFHGRPSGISRGMATRFHPTSPDLEMPSNRQRHRLRERRDGSEARSGRCFAVKSLTVMISSAHCENFSLKWWKSYLSRSLASMSRYPGKGLLTQTARRTSRCWAASTPWWRRYCWWRSRKKLPHLIYEKRPCASIMNSSSTQRTA